MILINLQNIQIVEQNMLPALQEVLYSDQTQEMLDRIAQFHDVSDFELSAIIGYVLLGLMPIAQIGSELEESCGLSPEEALSVVVDVRHYVLAPVAQELASIQEIAKKNYNTYKQ